MPSDSEATGRWLNDIGHHITMAEGFVAGMSYESSVVPNGLFGW
jgi:hypothetical protein